MTLSQALVYLSSLEATGRVLTKARVSELAAGKNTNLPDRLDKTEMETRLT